MAEGNPEQGHELQVAATAGSEPEADLICQRLAQAGIRATSQRSIGSVEWGGSGSRYVYVEASDLERAHEVLAVPDELSDEELTKLAEGSGPTPQT